MKVRPADRPAPGKTAGVLGTLVVHAAAGFFLFSLVKTPPPSPPVYAVNLVAAPAPAPKQRLAPEATPSPPPPEAPAPVKTTPKPEVKKVPVPKREEKPVEPTPRRDPTPKTSAPETPAPGETPSTGRDATTVKTPGLDFPYPEYLRNVENQIYRRWARPTGNVALRAEISFQIMRDGTVRNINFVTRSGNFSYDLEAQGAIEAAANAHAFGPLPDGWQADILPISFYFEPRPQ